MKKVFTENGWKDYLYWQQQDKKTLKRINQLIRSIESTPFEGLGKPEPLRFDYAGYWLRRINSQDRLIYCIKDEQIYILVCRTHYQ